MIRRLLSVFASRGEMPDPVDARWRSVTDDLWANQPQTPGERLVDEVETWLCANYCNHKEP